MKRYIAKPNTWFKSGTECKLETDCGETGGIFRGIRICENPLSEGKWHTIGEEYEDGELCSWNEFKIIDN